MGASRALKSVKNEEWTSSKATAKQVADESGRFVSEFNTKKKEFEDLHEVGVNLVHNVEGRVLWLEILKAVNLALPHAPEAADAPEGESEDVSLRDELHITELECKRFDDLSTWWTTQKIWYRNPDEGKPAVPADGASPDGAASAGETAATGPTGPGWVFQLTGYHFHNNKNFGPSEQGAEYVLNTLIKNLHQAELPEPAADGATPAMFPVGELGISYPLIVRPGAIQWEFEVDESGAGVGGSGAASGTGPLPGGGAAPGGGASPAGAFPGGGAAPGGAFQGGGAAPGGAASGAVPGGGAAPGGGFGPSSSGSRTAKPKLKKQPMFPFVVQFCWVETPPSKRTGPVQPTTPDEGDVAADGNAQGVAGGP
jgi:hypothetical protein